MKKRVVSFSLYGEHPRYLKGAEENAALARKFYPDWTCRFYVSQEISIALESRLRSAGADVIRKTRRHEIDGMFWRWLPTGERDLDVLLVRDADSRLSAREASAVREWIESGQAFHIMRDHPFHRNLIMGGMWGCRGHTLRHLQRMLWLWRWRRWRKGQASFDRYGLDQLFLSEVVYPLVRDNAMIHSELIRFEGEQTRPFPTPREHLEFVGAPLDEDGAVLQDFHLKLKGADLIVLPLTGYAPGVR